MVSSYIDHFFFLLSECPPGRYGSDCKLSCPCQKPGSRCDPVTGACECPPGWFGETCERPCLLGFYGTNCKQR